MVSKMIHLEDSIRKSCPNWNCDSLNDADLNSFVQRKLLEDGEDGMPEEIIVERLKSRTISTAEFENPGEAARSCDICLEDYKNQDEIASLNYCGHEFHTACIKAWLLQKNSCPQCQSLALVPNHYPDWVSDMAELRAFFKRDVSG